MPRDDELDSTHRRQQQRPDDTTERPGVLRRKDPLIGTKLGDYRVLDALGEGAMGIVYRGVHPVLGRPVAIKVMRDKFASEPAHAKRLLDEARAVAAIRHPNVIDVFGFGKTPFGQPYFVMELLDGDALDAYLKHEGGRLPVEEAIELLAQTAAALAAAHSAGVIHRDLKPANVFVVRLGDDTRFIKVLDFGVAKRGTPGELVRPTGNAMVGTPLYMPPEQAAATELGPYTDLYALGCIAYELLTGRPPFDAESLWALLEKHRVAPVPPVDREGVPPALNRLILELLEKEPGHRPASAGVVRRALERIGEQLASAPTRTTGLKAMPEARPTRIRPPPLAFKPDSQPFAATRRSLARPVLLGVLGVISAVALVAVGVFIGQQRRPLEVPVAEQPKVEPRAESRPTPPVAPRPVEPAKTVEPSPPRKVAQQRPKEKPYDFELTPVQSRINNLLDRSEALPNEQLGRVLTTQLKGLWLCTGNDCMKKLDEIEARMQTGATP